MMERNGFSSAFVLMSHAPMAVFPNLPDDAPVPLNIRAGQAGLIDEVTLWLHQSGGTLEVFGNGSWRWLEDDGSDKGGQLDPMVRLAEPAFLWGIGLPADPAVQGSGMVSVHLAPEKGQGLTDVQTQLGWSALRIWGPIPSAAGIAATDTPVHLTFGRSVSKTARPELRPGQYVLSRSEPGT